ncbi:DUF4314 domain-containing protein [Mycobacterium sp. DL440]|uniref:DUF4314 domain-containing protein n=1 Tax=Mycobacterium sp. DL440 TaxID=2675523 RepID=UPI00142306B3
MTVQPGDRVQITGAMPEEPDPVPVGTQGTVVGVNLWAQQADVEWDNGRRLFLLLDVDPYQVIARALEPTCKGMATNDIDEEGV